MAGRFSRSEMLIGKDALKKLRHSHVAVFGAGGVGGYAIEALVRAGVGVIDIIDPDKISLTNINRQIIAKNDTIGMYKVDVMAKRIREINPDVFVNVYRIFFNAETAGQFDFTKYDYVLDAIDTVSGKIALIMQAKEAGTPVISAMGAGNKLDPTRFEVADIYETSICPLAKVMRKELKKRGVESLKVVYSKEPPIEVPAPDNEEITTNKPIPGSISFVPSVAGLIMAGEVVKDIIYDGKK